MSPPLRRQSTIEWIQQAVSDKEKGEQCFALAAVHYKSDGSMEEIDRVNLAGGMSAKEVADRFDIRVFNHIHDLMGVQSCAFLAFYDGNEEPKAKFQFTKNGKMEAPAPGVSEAATPTGLIQMFMRHLEVKEDMYLKVQQATFAGLAQLAALSNDRVAALAEENTSLRNELADGYVIIKNQALDMATANDASLNQQMAVAKEQKSTLLYNTFLKWLPALANTLAQRKVFPESTEDTAIVEGLLSAMGPSSIDMLQHMLPPHVFGLVAARAKEIIGKQTHLEESRGEVKQIGTTVEGELQ